MCFHFLILGLERCGFFQAARSKILIQAPTNLSFFPNSCSSFIRQTFESTIFLFGTHPFDVGDVLFLDNDYHTVDEIQINFTVLTNSGQQRVWMPTQRLISVPFINLSNSGNRNEVVRFLVDIETSPTILEELTAALTTLKEETPNEISNIAVSFREAMVPMKMTIHVSIDLTHNGK